MNDKKAHVLLVNPEKIIKEQVSISSVVNRFPMGLLYIAAALKEIGIGVSVFDMRKDDIDNLILDDYLFVGITMLTGRMIKNGLQVAERIKKHNNKIPIVAGGVHPSVLPQQTLENKLIDFVVIGEGEETVKELALALIPNKYDSFSEIKGLGFKKNDRIYINPVREFINMDRLPIKLPYDLLGFDLSKLEERSLHTSRGCPYRCAFCYNVAINKRKCRAKNPECVIEEIEYLISIFPSFKRMNLQTEDEFFVGPERVHQILTLLVNKNIKLGWFSFIRFDTLSRINDEFLQLIQDSGVLALSLGGESGSQRLLDEIITKDITVEQILKGTERLKKAKITHTVSFMSCFPTEEKDDIRKTVNLIRQLSCDNPYFNTNGIFMFLPVPGTALFDLIVNNYNYKPPRSLVDWTNHEIGLFDTRNISWQNKNHIKLCQELSRWAEHRPFVFFRKYEDFITTDPKDVITFMLYYLISSIQKLRCKYLYFKFPFELILWERTHSYIKYLVLNNYLRYMKKHWFNKITTNN